VAIDPWRPTWGTVRDAARAIRRKEVIAIPTDTVYGLAGDPFQAEAVERIFRIKRRPGDEPILLLIASLEQLRTLVTDEPGALRAIAARFWPGPLTLILPASERVPIAITRGTGKVAVRWPAAPFAQALIREVGGAVTGTSANISGRPAAATAEEVARQLGNSVYSIVDGGRARTRQPSTIVDLTEKPRMVRPGALPPALLAAYLR